MTTTDDLAAKLTLDDLAALAALTEAIGEIAGRITYGAKQTEEQAAGDPYLRRDSSGWTRQDYEIAGKLHGLAMFVAAWEKQRAATLWSAAMEPRYAQ